MILKEQTLTSLRNSTKKQFGDSREKGSQQLDVQSYTITQFENNLEFSANVKNFKKNELKKVKVLFENVDISDEGQKNTDILLTNGGIISVDKDELNHQDCKVRCECLDFYWRFAMYNNQSNSLLGDIPEPYVKKTDRQPNNPTESPGLCKHLIAFEDYLDSIM